jgi:hypothetical protein
MLRGINSTVCYMFAKQVIGSSLVLQFYKTSYGLAKHITILKIMLKVYKTGSLVATHVVSLQKM